MQAAAAVACKGVASHICISNPAAKATPAQTGRENALEIADSSGSGEDLEPPPPKVALHIQADAELHSLVTSCCVETLWPLPAAFLDLEVTHPKSPLLTQVFIYAASARQLYGVR